MTPLIKALPLIALALLVAACEVTNPATATPTATRALSGPTLAPSPTIAIQSVDELDADSSLGQNDLTAASLPSGGALPPVAVGTAPASGGPQIVQIVMNDGVNVSGELYESGTGRVPGILLIGAPPGAWGDFPARLQASGFTVLAVQMREPATTADFSALLVALSEVGTVDPGSIAVIGAETGADMALIGCAVDLLCDTAALLSPLAGDTLLNIIVDYNPRPLLLAADQQDADVFRTVQGLEQLAGGEVLLQPLNNAGRGTAMLQARRDLGELIIQWMQRHFAG